MSMCQVMNLARLTPADENVFSSGSQSVSPESVMDDLLREYCMLNNYYAK